MTTHVKTTPILHADWSIRLGENRFDWALKHLAAMLAASFKRVLRDFYAMNDYSLFYISFFCIPQVLDELSKNVKYHT